MATHDTAEDQVKRTPIPVFTLPRPITAADVARLRAMAKRGKHAEESARRLLGRNKKKRAQHEQSATG